MRWRHLHFEWASPLRWMRLIIRSLIARNKNHLRIRFVDWKFSRIILEKILSSQVDARTTRKTSIPERYLSRNQPIKDFSLSKIRPNQGRCSSRVHEKARRWTKQEGWWFKFTIRIAVKGQEKIDIDQLIARYNVASCSQRSRTYGWNKELLGRYWIKKFLRFNQSRAQHVFGHDKLQEFHSNG